MRMHTVVALCALLGVSMSAMATSYVVRPGDLVASNDTAFASGASPFGYDQDGPSAPYATPADPAPGYDAASWEGSPAGYKDFFGFRISPYALDASGVVTFSEIESIAFQTKQLAFSAGRPDWYLKIYTLPRADQTSGWFGHRYEAFPGNVTDGVWNTWSSDTMLFNMRDGQSGGTSSDIYAFDDLQASYGDEQVAWIELIAGNNGTNIFTSNLDGIEIALCNGVTTTLNLEAPVPEPLTVTAIFAGLAGLGRYVRRRMA